MTKLSSRIMERFRWVDGHADVWRLFSDPSLFGDLTRALAEPFAGSAITKVAGIEARGFILGGAVAGELEAGFVAIRKAAGLFPGAKLSRESSPDYRGNTSLLRLQRASIDPGDRVLLVDDWFETGSQALAARALVEEAGGTFVGASVIVDQLQPGVRLKLESFASLVSSDSLGPSS